MYLTLVITHSPFSILPHALLRILIENLAFRELSVMMDMMVWEAIELALGVYHESRETSSDQEFGSPPMPLPTLSASEQRYREFYWRE